FNFYQSILGGEFTYIGRFGEIPESEDYKVAEGDKNKIMHVSLPVGNSILMGSDIGSEWTSSFQQGNNFSVSITADSKDEANKLFKGLSEEGQITMPLADTFWGDYFGMFTDKFGVNWMISFNEQQQSS
ncbi:MAG: VOC family protein, partial [Moheibacter sp.]